MSQPAYDRIGLSYTDFRQPDPRIEGAIWNALGDAHSVVNVGLAPAHTSRPTGRSSRSSPRR